MFVVKIMRWISLRFCTCVSSYFDTIICTILLTSMEIYSLAVDLPFALLSSPLRLVSDHNDQPYVLPFVHTAHRFCFVTPICMSWLWLSWQWPHDSLKHVRIDGSSPGRRVCGYSSFASSPVLKLQGDCACRFCFTMLARMLACADYL